MVSVEDLEINCGKTEHKIKEFISRKIEESGLDGAVVAVSGGIDSAVTLDLTTKALGADRVTALTMPERDVTPERDIMDVMQHCEALGVTCNTVDITPILRVMRDALPKYDVTDRITTGNIKPRVRMTVTYYFANRDRRIVMGTSNKTELQTGFFTKYGDGGVDLMPLADLYKTQLRQLARHLNIPENIIEKPPSPGFYPGHTDEDELGIDYTTLDLILYSLEKVSDASTIAEALGISRILVESVMKRIKANEHKRRLPLILRLG